MIGWLAKRSSYSLQCWKGKKEETLKQRSELCVPMKERERVGERSAFI